MTEQLGQKVKESPRPGFKITEGKGFHITFKNGWTVSVQFGPGNYGDNYRRRIRDDNVASGEEGSTCAETAVWPPSGEFHEIDGDSVQGYRTPAQVLELLNWAAAQEAPRG